jgi:glycosyltransferase involved in cell wall biosynthesis
MNIGIDAKWFFLGNPSGRVVIRNLLKELLQEDFENQYYVFLRKEDRGKRFPYNRANVCLVYIWSKNNMLSNVFVTPYFARKYKIDVFFYQYFGPFIKFSKVVTLIHDVIFESHPQYFSRRERLYFAPMRLLASRADLLTTTSASEKKRLLQYGYGTSEKIIITYWGVDSRFIDIRSYAKPTLDALQEKFQLPKKFVLYVGRLNYRKNIHTLIDAFQKISEDISLVLAGSYDWKMFDVNRYISERGLEKRVQLLGFVSDDDLPVLYALSQAFCFVSYEEGFGLPPLEAMACGVPVIVADCGSLPEVCGTAGIYVDPHNPATIATAIETVVRNKYLAEQHKELGRDQAAAFTWQRAARQYISLFNSLHKSGQ